ncbi:unnamed protein product [Caretta caretta]
MLTAASSELATTMKTAVADLQEEGLLIVQVVADVLLSAREKRKHLSNLDQATVQTALDYFYQQSLITVVLEQVRPENERQCLLGLLPWTVAQLQELTEGMNNWWRDKLGLWAEDEPTNWEELRGKIMQIAKHFGEPIKRVKVAALQASPKLGGTPTYTNWVPAEGGKEPVVGRSDRRSWEGQLLPDTKEDLERTKMEVRKQTWHNLWALWEICSGGIENPQSCWWNGYWPSPPGRGERTTSIRKSQAHKTGEWLPPPAPVAAATPSAPPVEDHCQYHTESSWTGDQGKGSA